MGLVRARRLELLARLGHPQRAFPVVHVAGTNGKGSTVVMTAEALRASGKRVGRFTSPHLTHARERIAIDGWPISQAEFAAREAVVAQAAAAVEAEFPDLPPFKDFDRWCAMAWCAFRDARVDVAVVETGMGGGRDATDLLERKHVTAVTAIGRDHMHVLGETPEAIAAVKAGIFRPGVPALTVAAGEAHETLQRMAAGLGAPCQAVEALPGAPGPDGHWSIALSDGPCRLGLPGPFQVENASLAVAILKTLGVGPAAVRAGLERARWPGRFERLADPRGGVWLIDGAHNLPAAEALASAWGPVEVVILAMQTTKEAGEVVERLTRGGIPLVLPPLADGEYWEARALAESAHGPVHPVEDLASAIALARTLSPGGLRAVTGSMYLVGAARAVLHGG